MDAAEERGQGIPTVSSVSADRARAQVTARGRAPVADLKVEIGRRVHEALVAWKTATPDASEAAEPARRGAFLRPSRFS
jgi:hypothetical protein